MYAGFHPDSWWLPPADNLTTVSEASCSDEEEATDRVVEERPKMAKKPRSILKKPSEVTSEGRSENKTVSIMEPYWKRVQNVSANEKGAASRVEEERPTVVEEPEPILKKAGEPTLEGGCDEKMEALDPFLRMFKFVFGDEDGASDRVEEERPEMVKEPTSILKKPAESKLEVWTNDKREAEEPYWIQDRPNEDDGKL